MLNTSKYDIHKIHVFYNYGPWKSLAATDKCDRVWVVLFIKAFLTRFIVVHKGALNMGSWFICMYLLCVYKPLTFGVTLPCNALYLPSSSLFILFWISMRNVYHWNSINRFLRQNYIICFFRFDYGRRIAIGCNMCPLVTMMIFHPD